MTTRPITTALTRIVRAATIGLALGGTATGALAQSSEPPAYMARALHQLPDGTTTSGLVVKSGPDMRLEYTENGTRVVQIIRRAQGLVYLLDPARQSYMEIRTPPAADPTGTGYMPPCQQGEPGLTCTFKGNEVSSGITAELWEIAANGQPGATVILWDGARHRALRQEFPDGSRMQMTFKAMEQISGRSVEHWTIAYETAGQEAQAGDWFYDPELRVELREVMPSGETRSLDEITVGPVDPGLFQVPGGWTRVEMPAPPAGAN